MILAHRHIHQYVEDQNREIPLRRDSMDFQAAVDAYCTIWVKDGQITGLEIAHIEKLLYKEVILRLNS
jgi:hypothetical protein